MDLKQIIRESLYRILQEDLKSNMEGRTDYFTPTKEWMVKWYSILNTELFDGSLPACNLVTGKVAIDKIGYFTLSNGGLSKQPMANGKHKVLVRELVGGVPFNVPLTPENVSHAKPKICLNTNYVADEYTWVSVLLHEMCHFYDRIRGECDRDAHGQDFTDIVTTACSKSNGFFTPQKVLTSEEMNTKKIEDYDTNKVKNRQVYLIIMKDDSVRLYPSSSKTAITKNIMMGYCRFDKTKEVRELTRPDSLNLLVKYDFLYDIRSDKYYSLSDKFPNALEEFMDCPYTEIYNCENATERTEEDENQQILEFMKGIKVYVMGMKNGQRRMYLSRSPKFKKLLLDEYCNTSKWYEPDADYLYEYDNDALRIWFFKKSKKVSKPQTTINTYWELSKLPSYESELEKYDYQILFGGNDYDDYDDDY